MQPIQLQKTRVTVSASIDIALSPENGVTAEDLTGSTDKAMYQVQHSGKNSFGFTGPGQTD